MQHVLLQLHQLSFYGIKNDPFISWPGIDFIYFFKNRLYLRRLKLVCMVTLIITDAYATEGDILARNKRSLKLIKSIARTLFISEPTFIHDLHHDITTRALS